MEVRKETSFWKEFVILNRSTLDKNGNFDFRKVPDLFIQGAGSVIKYRRKELGISQQKLASVIKKNKDFISRIEKGKQAVSIKHLEKITEFVRLDLFKTLSGNEIRFGYGKKHKSLVKFPLKPVDIEDFVGYLTPKSDFWNVFVRQGTDINGIEELFDIEAVPHENEFVLKSSAINRFLRTFFVYKKEAKCNLPQTDIVKKWYYDNVNLKHAICVYGLTDAFLSGRNFSIRTVNPKINEMLTDLFYLAYSTYPSSHLVKNKPGKHQFQYYSSFYLPKYVISELLGSVNSFKTSPRGTNPYDYLDAVQPSYDFLRRAKLRDKAVALRILLDTEGSVIPKRSGPTLVPSIKISCAHPKLVLQLQKIFDDIDIHFYVAKGDTWSGYEGLQMISLSELSKLLKLCGGFTEGVKMSGKYYKGYDKQDVLLATVEMGFREREFGCSNNLRDIHIGIKKIIEEKAFKNPECYIKKLKERVYVRELRKNRKSSF